MQKLKIPHWLAALLASWGGLALFAVAFLDSSFLSFPLVTDLLVMGQAAAHPQRLLYYAAMPTLGSLLGCLALYVVARQGGEWYYRRRAGKESGAVRAWVARNGFVSILVASLLPPPLPFKAFILAAGALAVPWRAFVLALLAGRGARYLLEGALAIRYGATAAKFLVAHKVAFASILLAAVALSVLAGRLLMRNAAARASREE